MKIRKATPKDIDSLHKMLNAAEELAAGTSPETYSKKFIKGMITNKERDFVLIAEEDKKIIGFITAEMWKHKGYSFLADIFVAKEHRKKGVAKELYDEYEKICKKEKLERIWGLTLMNNKKIQSILKKWGYNKGDKFCFYEKILK